MKGIRKIIASGLLAAAMFGCGKTTIKELSDVFNEEATVTETTHTDGYYQVVPLQIGDMTIMSQYYEPEVNRITFNGKVNFTVDDEKVYKNFKKGDSAKVLYQEVYEVSSDNGKLNREPAGYNFITAIPLK